MIPVWPWSLAVEQPGITATIVKSVVNQQRSTMPTRPRSRPKPAPAEPELVLDDAHSIAILEKAVEYEVIDETGVPDTAKKRIAAAAEQVDLLIEAWTTGGINPYSDDPEKVEMGEAIQEILDLAGVEIDENDEVSYVDLPDLEDGGEPEADGNGGGEAAFDINDTIEGYEELSAASRVKAIKALELDMDDDDDYNTAVGIYEWEDGQEKPSSRVLAFLDEMLPQDGAAAEGEAEAEGDESAEEAGDGSGEEAEGWQQPWTKADGAAADYDKMDAVAVKKHLDKLLAKEELSEEMLDYVRDYENDAGVKAPRKRILDYIDKLRGEVGEGGGEEEAAPARSARPTAARRQRSGGGRLAGISAKEEEPETVEPGVILVSTNGDEPISCYGIWQAAGAVADLLANGAESVQVDAG